MSMQIMWKRYYNEAEITPALFMAQELCLNAESYAFNRNQKNFSGNEHTEKFIVPIRWEDELEIYGLVAPINFPIYSKQGLDKMEVKQEFLEKWKKMWGGGLFHNCFWFIQANVRSSKATEIQSYINWKKSKHKERLALIYLGNFWLYKDEEETLNQAAERFFNEHKELQGYFRAEWKRKYWEDYGKYAKAILDDGGLLFDQHSNKAYSKFNDFGDPATAAWRALCILGYFQWVSRLEMISEWDYDAYIK